MGIFDWLLGRKKDPYGGKLKRDYRDTSPSSDAAHGMPNATFAPEVREPFIHAPLAKQRGWSRRRDGLSWRRKRSKQEVSAPPDQSIYKPLWSSKASKHASPARVEALGLPNIDHVEELAELLGVSRNQLVQYLVRDNGRYSEHYVTRELAKKSGGTRTLFIPKPRLKALQRLLHQKLVRKLPLTSFVHGFRRGHDTLSGASIHVQRDVVICLDITNFFPSFDFRRVSGYFRATGYSREVAIALANLTTVRQPQQESPYAPWHPALPQGAPTSPGIANAICWRMDKRLAALAHKFGGDYTRYADDLTFSGFEDMARHAAKFISIVEEIVGSEGLYLNEKKTRIMRKGRQQRVTGVVVNSQTNVSRREFDRLKAILHNCIKHGPDGQNRENVPDFREHLRGRIAHITHIGPERGRKLKRMFDEIRW